MKTLKLTFVLVCLLCVNSCDNLFEYSVYKADVKSEHLNTTAKNLALLNTITITSDTFKFAFISDSHYFYDGLQEVINHINKNDDIEFVIHGGDITEQALLKEYEIFYDIMTELKKPYLTVIGNHDYNSNGSLIYSRMFGDFNYTFQFNNNKFVFFDNIVWESEKNPDFDWLSAELQNNESFNQVFVIGHIPPLADQFTPEMTETYEKLMSDNEVSLSLNGHTHSYKFTQDEVGYLTVPALKESAYVIVTVKNGAYDVELIEL